ncbi:hypothetical protein [Metapseudomonas otitidis]|uniref:hypothetical protein n=1 Tax=Metapseudomonas otitidis TaxID=319939 RepID=UPI0013F61D20|nr:hypothetical protein [Pseudomonas otitidis]
MLAFLTPVLTSGYQFGFQPAFAQGTACANGAGQPPPVIFYNLVGPARLKDARMAAGSAGHYTRENKTQVSTSSG